MLAARHLPARRPLHAPLPHAAVASLPALICGLFFVSGLAQTAIVPLLPRLAVHYGLSSSETALVLALPGLAMLTVSVPAGVLADRWGARRITLISGVLLAVGCAAQGVPCLPALVAGRIVFGVSFGVLWTAGAAWLSGLGGRRAGVGRDAGGIGRAVFEAEQVA